MRFFIAPEDICGGTAVITGDDAVHIGVCLRARPGDRITVCDGNLNEYSCEITSVSKASVAARVLSHTVSRAEMPVRVHIFQSVPKGERLDTAVQKAVEGGAYDLTLIDSKYCVARFDEKSAVQKTQRLRKISEAAAKQCGRGIIPQIYRPVPIAAALRSVPQGWLKLFCYENESTSTIRSAISGSGAEDIALFIGAEGGYSPDEAQDARGVGFVTVGLGRRILRCETAGLFALACIAYETEL